MENETSIQALDKNGRVVFSALFTPFFKSIFPVLSHQAKTVKIEVNCAQTDTPLAAADRIFIRYRENNRDLQLEPQNDFDPWEVFPRLRILSGVSIIRQPVQKGNMTLLIGAQRVSVDVEFDLVKETETLTMTFDWAHSCH